jgi:FkbM family methyltransferase
MLKLTSAVRHMLESLLARCGYELKVAGTPPRGFEGFLRFAKELGLAPRTIVDVGVGHGTHWLYEAFPDAKLALFEPLKEFHGIAHTLGRSKPVDLHPVALAAEAGTLKIRVPRVATGASLFPRSDVFEQLNRMTDLVIDKADEYRMTDVDTLDARCGAYEAPILLKIDAEGGELGVLRGAIETLRRTVMVLVELSVFERHVGEPSLVETMQFLDEHGFQLFDIPAMEQFAPNGPLSYIDTAFVRKGGALARANLGDG